MLFDGHMGRIPFLKGSQKNGGILGFFSTFGIGIKQFFKDEFNSDRN
jgi:hypothetical protein